MIHTIFAYCCNIGLYTITNHVNLIEIESEDNTSDKLNLKFPDIDQLIKAIPSNKLQENRRKLKTGFKLFQVYFMALSYIHINQNFNRISIYQKHNFVIYTL